ncbi:MAG TPA: alpha/beta fold hydrolase [Rhizomicrobium sp.]|nr:alpha/beta fold hydrolase [Rhizomicrobium sp.]
MLAALAGLLLLAAAVLAATIALSSPKVPPHMASVSDPFIGADFSALPPKRIFTARDGTKLVYRAYPGDPGRIVVLIHGSSGTSESMHPVAEAIRAKGATVYALGMRGHDGTGRSGDIDYIGQLDDDLHDFLKTLGPRTPSQTRTLLGFSTGGGFALRFAGSTGIGAFDRLVLVSPQLPYDAPTSRAGAGGWASVALPRIIGLTILDRFGIAAFGGLPVLAFAVDRTQLAQTGLTPVYSYRMMRNFGPQAGYRDDLKRVKGPIAVLIGATDEIFYADRYAPLVKSIRPDATVTVVPGLTHIEMTVRRPGLDAIAAAIP